MAKNRYSEALSDAYMRGDKEAISQIKSLIKEEDAAVSASRFPTTAKQKRDEIVIKYNTLLNDDNSKVVDIYNFMVSKYGGDWWENEIETIDRLLFLDFGLVLSDVNRDKVLSLRHLCRDDSPFYDWYLFNQLALSLGGAISDFEYLKKPSPGMIINAVHVFNYIRPDRKGEFGVDVLKYICISLINDGIYTPPPSIAPLIGKTMNDLTSKGSAKYWGRVGDKFEKAKKDKVTDETSTGIQSRRLLLAESASERY